MWDWNRIAGHCLKHESHRRIFVTESDLCTESMSRRENYGTGHFISILRSVITSGRKVGFESYILDITPDEQRTVYLGIRGMLNIFAVLLPILGVLFIETLGYYFTFGLVTGIMLLAFFLLDRKR